MRKVKVTMEYEWVLDAQEWGGLMDWDNKMVELKVKERLEFDPVSSFYSLSQIKVPTPTRVKVDKITD